MLIERLRDLAPIDTVEKNDFGAPCWVLEGHVSFGVHADQMLVRLGPAADPEDLKPFDPIGKGQPMAGWFLTEPDRLAEDNELQAWMAAAISFTTLPSK